VAACQISNLVVPPLKERMQHVATQIVITDWPARDGPDGHCPY
jgi:hypothetical protein